jgi:hypothetical protein
MIETVKCVTKGCDLEGQVRSAASLFFNRIAPLDGPFICPICGNPMKVVTRIPLNKGKSGKPMSRTSSRPTGHKVGKKKVRKALTVTGAFVGGAKRKSKAAPKKPAGRKRRLGK